MDFKFEPQMFLDSAVKYMGSGMLMIFVVIGAIVLTTMALNKIFAPKQ